MSIELWAARLERPLTERETEAMLPLLPPERQERLLRIKQSEKRREPLCAYLILRHALWDQYRWRELPPIRLTSLGKPYFPDFPEVHFNLSHTTGAVLVALSGEPVGVDIEHIRPVSERAMRRLADVTTERAFFQSWVRREARGQAQRRRRGDHAGVGDPAPAWGAILFSGHLSGLCGGSGHPDGGPPGQVRKYSLDEMMG